jgi:exosortase D (VPLPA-CTERM-specific)
MKAWTKYYLDNTMMNMGKFILYLLLILTLYYSAIEWLIVHDWSRDDYSYGILIPFIVIYLIWEKKRFFLSKPSQPNWFGFLIMLPGLILFWFGELAGEFFMLYCSAWLIAVGLCWMNMGWKKLKIIIFPIAFSLAMFPFPNFINVKITLSLKLLSSKIGVWMMQACGMSAYREGNVIDIGSMQLQVVDACSGLRYLFPMIVLSLLIAYFYKAKFWKKMVIILSSVPLTIFTNSLRIALTGILSEKYGAKVISGFFHDFEGWLIFMITIGVLLGEIWLMNKLFPESSKVLDAKKETRDIQNSGSISKKGKLLIQPQFVVSVVLLVLTLVLSKGIEFREAVPMSRSFKEFPMEVNKWSGTRREMEKEFIDTLDLTDYIMADYVDEESKNIDFYVAYYESQRKGKSIHSPASCLRGGGWQFNQTGSRKIGLQDGTSIPVNRAVIEKGSVKQLSYYWFPSRDRILTNAYQMKIYNFWDALTQKRTDGALVRIITYVDFDENIADAEKRMQTFVTDINPVLKKFLPE